MQKAMQRVINVFDDFASARHAVERLLDAGFPADDVHVARGDQADLFLGRMRTEAAAAHERDQEGDRGALPALGHFMASILGVDTPQAHARTYLQAMLRGSSLVLVDISEAGQADLAGGIMRELGAVDLDQRIAGWRDAGAADEPPQGGEETGSEGRTLPGVARSGERESAMAKGAGGEGRGPARDADPRSRTLDGLRDKPNRGDA